MIFLWLVLYGLAHVISNVISWSAPFVMAIYLASLLLWLAASGRGHDIGLCAVSGITPSEYFYFMPLTLLPIYNLCNLFAVKYSFEPGNVVVMVAAAITEEIYFRGFLLSFLLRRNKNRRSAVWISSVIFAALHCANFTGGADTVYTVMQVLCAFSLGVLYSVLVVLYRSILPCIAAHILVNLSGLGSNGSFAGRLNVFFLLICILAQTVFGIMLLQKIKLDSREAISC